MRDVYLITSQDAVFNENKLYAFKKNYQIWTPLKGRISITADARYKLWINGKMVDFGPYKGTAEESYYNTVDIIPYLKEGVNEFYAEVLQLAHPHDISKHRYMTSVYRTGNLAFGLWGEIETAGEKIEVVTDETWECMKREDIEFIVPEYAYYGGIGESRNTKVCEWKSAVNLCPVQDLEGLGYFYGETKLRCFSKHNLPKQRYEKYKFKKKDLNGHYDSGKVVTGFIHLKAEGKGRIKLTYAESYVFFENGMEVKRKRSDTSGYLCGDYDVLEISGHLDYETFWFRTFRYVKVECEGNVEISDIGYYETGYPLEIHQNYDFGNKTDNQLWEISLNTLKNCMHETHEDCPYYEQLQYTMDTYLQIVFSLQLSGDCRLAKKAIHDFALSCYADNICQGRYPSVTKQYITGFTFFFVWMLEVLEKKCGEHKFIKKYLGTVDTIFQAIEKYKREDGLISKNGYWNFIDWTENWDEEHGLPSYEFGEAHTIYNMMYRAALLSAAKLNHIFHRDCIAKEYEKIADYIGKLLKEKCFDNKRNLYRDIDTQEVFSQHAQVWAVLSGMADEEQAKKLLKEAEMLNTKGGYAYSFFVLRALERANCYELSENIIDKYRILLEYDCTTIPERIENPRSECHAWGAVVLYEFTAMVLGVQEKENEIVKVKPYIAGRENAKGTVYTKYGEVYVKWTKENAFFEIEIVANKNTKIQLFLPDGRILQGRGKVHEKCMFV